MIRRVVAVVAVLVAVSLLFSHAITDWQWFVSLGYLPLMVAPWAWRLAVGVGAGLLSFVVLYANLLAARPVLARAYLRPDLPRLLSGRSWQWVRRWSTLLVVALSAALGVSAASQWMDVALFFHQQPFGIQDPVFGHDVAFYVFTLPAVQLVTATVMAAVLLGGVLSLFVYALAGLLDWRHRGEGLAGRPRVHLMLLLAALALLWGVESWLARYDLLFSPRGVFFGASYADVHVRMPARAVAAVLAGVTAVLTAWAAVRGRTRWAAGAAVAALVASVGGGLLAEAVQQVVVRPNELAREEPYLRHHIEMTRRAYALDRVQEVAFEPAPALDAAGVTAAEALLREVRLWDWRPLLTVYAQLQAFRPYYSFLEVDVDRYLVNGRLRQVMLAVRELDTSRLQNPSWVNLRLQYTHGYGVVMSPVAEVTAQGLPRLAVANLPPRSEPGWPELRRPEVYFGELLSGWVVVGGRRPEFDYPTGDENVFTRYEGRDGVRLGWWNRLLFATRFGSPELLLSREVGPDSRVLMYRNVMERIQRLVPYLRYDRDPYPVVTDDGRLVWMVDAYTATDRFPYARPVAGWGNYVRASVKVTVDAYDGTVDFYLVDPAEPLAAALSSLLGGFMKPLSEMPEDLRRHIRYPQDFFMVQAVMLASYHMENPVVFYNQEDRWDIGREIYGEAEVTMEPYYAMVDLGEGPEFALLLPFTATGRQNMVAWMAARCDGERYGEVQLYVLPKQELTYGPMQLEARINQDPDISRELTLWGQRGSRVLRGNLIVVPVAGTILYVEPLFLVSEQSQLPELRRIVAGTQTQLAMATDLSSALRALTGQGLLTSPEPGGQPPQEAGAPVAGLPSSVQQAVREALQALESARQRLAQGDWGGFGRSMQELQRLLERLAGDEAGDS
ncbi:MAG TPA: UPF0182 family protein [Limnochordales bacterium]